MSKVLAYGSLKRGLVLDMPLRKRYMKSATVLTDRTPYGNDGTNVGAIVGELGTKFDGVDDKIDCGSEFIGAKACSIVAWINPKGYGENGTGRIVNNGNKLNFQTRSTNTNLQFFSGGITTANSKIGSITLNQWQHVCATRTVTGIANIYINGILSGPPNQATGTPAAGNLNVYIGNHENQTTSFDGLIDSVRIYNRVLSAIEVEQSYRISKWEHP